MGTLKRGHCSHSDTKCIFNVPKCKCTFQYNLLMGTFWGHSTLLFIELHQLPVFHLQLFPLESLDVCCSCRLHLLLKTEVNICSAVLQHRKVYHAVMLSRTSKLPPKTPKRALQYPRISRKPLAADVSARFTSVCRVLVCCLFVQGLQQTIDVVTICTQLHIH